MNTPPRRERGAYDEPCALRQHLQEGYDTRALPPPDTRIGVSPGATRWAMRVTTTPSRRKQSSLSSICPKIDQVFTLANTHHHQTPHPAAHAAHTAMANGQHLTTGSANEHRGTTPRGATLASKTWTPPHSRPTATQPKIRVERIRLSHPWLPPTPKLNRPPNTGLHRPAPRHQARDELGPDAGREMSTVLLPGARWGRSYCRA